MALNTFKCNHLTPLGLKGLTSFRCITNLLLEIRQFLPTILTTLNACQRKHASSS